MLVNRGAVLCLLAALPAAVAEAQDRLAPQALRQMQALLAEKASRTPVQRRIDSQLLAASRVRQGREVARGIPDLPSIWDRVLLLPGDIVLVDIRATVTPVLLEGLRRQGARIESAHAEYDAVRARIPLARVETVAALDGVAFVEPAHLAVTNTGAVTSQGDAAHRAPQARALGLTGAGIKVGVLSDGVGSLATSQATGDLPTGSGMTVLPGQAGTGNEGTAMLEIVHDLAPAARLAFATAFSSPAAFAANIRALRDAGCQVIVDDVTYFNEGAFQDGPIAQAVNDVTSTGVLYFSSAANSGNLTSGTSGTWEGDWANSGVTIPAIDAVEGGASPIHRFATGQNSNPITLASGPVTLKWSDPLGASANDYDLFILDGTLSSVIASSTSSQSGTQDPYEIVSGQAAGRRVVVVNWLGGAATRALRIDTNRGRLAIATAGSTYGHNGGEKTISVAATDGRAPGPGNPFVGGASNPIQTYSSDGPRRIFYEPNGTAITPGNLLFATGGGRLLLKPDVTAADCVSTTVGGFTLFCGTSAAAPHAGAIAALLLSAAPAPAPALVRATLGATALDVMAAGVDRDSGSGIAMADRGAASADLEVAMTGPAAVGPGSSAAYLVSVTNNGVGSATSVLVSDPTPAGLSLLSTAGDCTTPFPCALGTLGAGETRRMTATFNVPASYGGPNPFTNTASAAAGSTDPVGANDSAAVTTAVVVGAASADLALANTGPAFASRGEAVVYTLVVANDGPDEAASVSLADPTPAGLAFVSNAGDCTTAFPCALGSLDAGATRTVTATFAVPADYPASQAIVNTASVSAATGDPVPSNNVSTATSRFGTFHTLTPCRLADTRDPASPGGPPALQPGAERTFVLAGRCGLPEGATAVAVNVTVTGPTHLGSLRLFPADAAAPLASSVNFRPGETRANNAVVAAPADGSVALTVKNESLGPVHLVLDVAGYFQ
jgi:uncharacterized repeat protein (TIGR01451 family)